MSITVAESAGFCFGVKRAVELVEQQASMGGQVATLGPIIHNRHAVKHFEDMGVKVLGCAEDAQPGSTVVIRSHGVTKAVQQQLESRGVQIVDATCPFVKRIHNIVSQAQAEDRQVIIIGTRSHPEVEGIAGWCANAWIFEIPEELQQWCENGQISGDLPICMVCQTTSTEYLWKLCVEIAKKQFTNGKIFDTICRELNPDRMRQQT